jgi:hypothetical protein
MDEIVIKILIFNRFNKRKKERKKETAQHEELTHVYAYEM